MLYDADGTRGQLTREWYERGFYSEETLPRALAAGCAKYAGRNLVFHSQGRTQSHAVESLYEQGRSMAGALHRLGIRPGDVVGIQVPNRVEGYVSFLGAMLAGAVVLPIVHIYGAREVSFLLRESGARALLVPDRWRRIDYLERLRGLSDVPQLDHRIVIGEEVPAGCIPWSELQAAGDFTPPPLRADDVALILFTSGTTSHPKGVLHSHNSLLAELRAAFRPEGTPSVVLSPWPAGHIAGVLSILRLFFSGGESVLMDAWDAGAAAALVEKFRVTRSSGTPYHVNSLLDAAEADGRDLSSLSDFLVGAAAVPPEVVERCGHAGIVTYRSYGSTEHPTVTSGTPEHSMQRRAHTDGVLNPGCRIRIVDDEGADVPPGEAGEIVSQGPEQFLGYHREKLNDDAFLPGGWFRTGDVGRLDAGGFLTVTDRKKDIIIRGGENIASKEVEDYLAVHPAVSEAAVVAAPDERFGERVCAFVLLRPGQALTIDDVRAHFAALQVARQKTPERLEIVTALPRTPSGKVRKYELRERLRAPAADQVRAGE